jgi:hypothetical protein
MTNETKQTAVDWQFDQLSSENLLGIFTHDQMTRVMEILEQAKEMEKEQIEDAFQEGKWDWAEHILNDVESKDASQYYNETYGGKK